jgi:hypothetical protein
MTIRMPLKKTSREPIWLSRPSSVIICTYVGV